MKTPDELKAMEKDKDESYMVGYYSAAYELLHEFYLNECERKTIPKKVERMKKMNPIPKPKTPIVKHERTRNKKIPMHVFVAQLNQLLLIHKTLTRDNMFLMINDKIEISRSAFDNKIATLIKSGAIQSTGNKGGRGVKAEYCLPLQPNGRFVIGNTARLES